MDRIMMISADTHGGCPSEQYRDYLDPQYRDRFDGWLVQMKEMYQGGGGLFSEDSMEEFQRESQGGRIGAWDNDRRIQELESDGVIGEIIFPDGSFNNAPPWTGLISFEKDPELRIAGARAHNRWLAEFCAKLPQRRAGLALIEIDDIENAVQEIKTAKDSGLRGGILIPGLTSDLPGYNHPRYEPIWATCEELGMPVHTHGGATPGFDGLPSSMAIFVTETSWYSHRPFWFLLWSGVFERHPKLTFVLTEQSACWIPDTLFHLDQRYDSPMFMNLRKGLSLKPSEYWARQCYVGASMMSRHESEMRHEIGVDRIMWGSDYPHLEGTWPHTRQKLQGAFKGIPEAEVRLMLGENAARVYNFDAQELAADVERVGPEADVF